ncbi:transmembrane protein 200A-like [Oncorhynchus kisutch]|uniref:Transmembrane protein 200A-like n=1 Tax=Oncorhynchus kisutch TaxID=8019 RepID=A0A8C7KX56_ONCKI|nr:transmembrane protein 200A-like [Oncorhynchus kisutch]
MIATGGLLRMNRRQDSQRSKNHAENQRKRKQAERKKRNDVVVVKGKLNLCSPSGLVAAVGVVVLMLGIAMAVLGYWPHEGHSQGKASGVSPGEERRDNGRMSYSKSPLVSVTWSNNKDNNTANLTVGELTNQTVEELTNQTVEELTNQTVGELTNQTVGELTNQTVEELTNQTVEELTNQTSAELTNQMSDVMNGSVPQPISVSTSPHPPSGGFLSEFLDSYLYSDNLKVFGPLVMGIGIFLFICANAVLHENRDEKTKVINLRDIYSTVIDHHSTRTKDYSPINGLVNYVQSRGSVDINSGSFHPGEMLEHNPWPSTTVSSHQGEIGSSEQQYRRPSMVGRQRSWSRDNQTFTESVYSIYRDQKRRCSEQTPYPRQWDSEQASYPRQWDSEQASYPRQWDSEQASYPRQWDSEQASYPRQWDSEQASYPRQRDSEQASYPRQWDSEQASYPRQWDSEQASYPRQWDSEQASYPRQWEGTASIVSSSFNVFTLPIITLNNGAVEEGGQEGGQAEREEEVITDVKDFSGNGIEQVAGYSQSLDNTEKDSSRRTSMNHLEYEGGTVMTLTEPDEALQGQTLTPQGPRLFPPSPVFRATTGMGSRLSLNSLSSPGVDQPQPARRCSLTVAVCRQGDRARRFSCTRLERSNSKGYIKLETGDSFDVPDVVTSCVPDSNQEEEVVADKVAEAAQ